MASAHDRGTDYAGGRGAGSTPIAIVGLACRFPDADDPLALFESALAGRRAFRRLPPGRSGTPAGGTGPGGWPPRAALLEGWQFSRAEFGIAEPEFLAADPAHWLALETAGRALADAGYPGGQGLTRERAGVIIGNTLTGEISRALALRTRWTFIRSVLATALAAGEIPAAGHAGLLRQAAAAFDAPFPPAGAGMLAGSQPGAIAERIARHFGFRGGSQAVDTAHSSALLAVAMAGALLAAGELDFVLAGGVDISLDPFELGGLAEQGLLADGVMRIYDTSPTGFLPGEGCGVLALMRSADARAADMPSYADIVGWGVSSAGQHDLAGADPDSQLLALQRAYQRAGVDPADIQLIEGDGRGTADGDLAELTALARIRAGAAGRAALGSVKANIGHTKAAAGAAGLIKAALAVNAGVIPPVTGCARPHELLASDDAALRVPRSAESWPPGTRLAGVSSVDPAGSNVHVVLRRERHHGPGPAAGSAVPAAPDDRGRALGSWSVPGVPRTEVFTFAGPDRGHLARRLAEVAAAARGLSDGELSDLACQLGRQPGHGPARVAVVAADQDELARRCQAAARLLPGLAAGRLAQPPGLFAADGTAGRVVLLFPGELAATPAGADRPGAASGAEIVPSSLSALRELDRLGLRAAAAVGHGAGEITGLVWSGSLAEADAAQLVAERAVLPGPAAGPPATMICVATDAATALSWPAAGDLVVAADHGPRCQVLAGPADEVRALARHAAAAGIQARVLTLPNALHTPAMTSHATRLRGVLAGIDFAPPGQQLFSTVTGRAVTADTDLPGLLCDQLSSRVRLAEAVRAAAGAADLLLDTGPGQAMAQLAAGCCAVPAVSLAAGSGGTTGPAAAAALFAVGAIADLGPLLAGRPSRPVDLARPRIFLTNPCAVATASLGHIAEAEADPGAGRAVSTAPQPAVHGPGQAAPYPGVAPWVRCFAEELRAPAPPVPRVAPVDEEPWRLHATTRQPFGRMAAEVFEDDPAASGVLAVIGDLADPDGTGTLVAAAHTAAGTGRLVVITPAAGLGGFCASLHAELPALGITLIRTADSMAGLLAAQRFAAAEPGQFRELVLDPATGEPREPATVLVAPAAPAVDAAGGGSRPDGHPPSPDQPAGPPARLGPGDTALITGGPAGHLLAAAQLLAASGARLTMAGLAGPGPDTAIGPALARLRQAGTEVSYVPADLSDPDAAEAAIARVEQQAGPVSAVFHLASMEPPTACGELSGPGIRGQVALQADQLSNVLGAVSAAGLRLLVTLGPASAHYGAAGYCATALTATALAEQARRLQPGLAGCRIMHADLDGLPGLAGEPPGQSTLLGQPGPAGDPAAPPADLAGQGELLLDMLASPPGPARIAIHGRRPAAEPASTGLAGRFLETVRVHSPGVELVAEARISEQTDPYLAGYSIDGLTMLPPAIGLEALAQAASALAGRPLRRLAEVRMPAPVLLPAGRESILRVCALRHLDSVETVLRWAGSGFRVDHFRAVFPLTAPAGGPAGADGAPGSQRYRPRMAAAPGGIVDGTDLYGRVCFQDGPFRRLAFLPEVTARSCQALVRGADDRPWFARPEDVAAPLILGSPGLNDAIMHMLQACVPHRRVLPAALGSLTVSGTEVRGAVQVRAERDGESGWMVTAVDAAGLATATLSGLRMCGVGPLGHPAPWHPALLAAMVQGRAVELGLDPALRVTLSCGQPGQATRAGQPRPDGVPWLDARTGTGPLAGFELSVRASRPVACYWEAAGSGAGSPGARLDGLAQQLHDRRAERPEHISSRLRAIAACLAAAGRETAGGPVTLTAAGDADWVQVRAGAATIACTVAALDGVAELVTIALATWLAPACGGKPIPATGAGREATEHGTGAAVPSAG